ncbi:ABC transporter permease [Rheinheimera sp. F8]|uniref:ABC transporter permease n=1 Tax=Rheinheimera sp. F8 TaxID=1763998 RepID=UPI0007449E74|nr:ABC transporter permease [Rheinheimera sp. F8]ALZ76650.1 sodium ABC transporter permease [Rheinheimera sp. F8]
MWQVYLKELLELSRDRKTLMFVILLPILIFPVIFGLLGLVAANVTASAQAEEHKYVIINADKAPTFAEQLFYHKNFKQVATELTEPEALRQAIRGGQFDLAVIIPADFTDGSTELVQSQWTVIYNTAPVLDLIGNYLKDVVKDYSRQLQLARLESVGVTGKQVDAVLEPVQINKVSSAENRENLGEKLGGWIAYLLVPLCFMGCSYPAIDIGAGEKERGTLETLLICPISRSSLVLGKFLTVLTTGLATALITVLSFGGWGYLIGSLAGVDVVAKAMSALGFTDLMLILAMLIPLTMIFASALLSLSIYARSFKEAQNYIGPMSILVFVPLALALLPGVELNWKTALIPMTNISLCIKELVKGTIDMGILSLVIASTVLLAGILIAFCVSWFQREKVLFR